MSNTVHNSVESPVFVLKGAEGNKSLATDNKGQFVETDSGAPPYEASFSDESLIDGKFTANHKQGVKLVNVVVADAEGNLVITDNSYTDKNNAVISLANLQPITGEYSIKCSI